MVTTRPSTLGVPGRTTAPGTSGRASVQDGAGHTTTRGDRMYALDALRFAAAFGVLLYHFTARWHRGWGEDPGEVFPVLGHVSTYFALAPELFFVVSGFVILWTAWGRTVPGVAASRLSRIYPAYWTALAMTTFLLMVLWPDGKRVSWAEVAVNVTLLQEAFGVRHVDGVYWTLWAELRFYLLIVLLVAVGLTRRRVLAFTALWPLAGLLAQESGLSFLETLLVSRYAPLFAGGMLLYLIHRDGHARVPWLLLAGNVAIAVHNIVPAQMRSLSRNTIFEPNPWLLGLLTVGCFATVGLVALTRLRRISWAPLATLGALTYPLYLIHEYWGWWVIDRLAPHLPTSVVLALAIVLSLALAVVIHHGVEKRWTRVARRALEARLTALGDRLRGRRGDEQDDAQGGARSPAGSPAVVQRPTAVVWSDAEAIELLFSRTPGGGGRQKSDGQVREAPDRFRRRSQPPGMPPTTPGGREPSRMPAHSSALRASSSWTAEPTPPGR